MRNLGIGKPEDSLSESVGKRKIEAVVQTKTCVGTDWWDSERVRAWVLDSAAVNLSPGCTPYYVCDLPICKRWDDNNNTYLIVLF